MSWSDLLLFGCVIFLIVCCLIIIFILVNPLGLPSCYNNSDCVVMNVSIADLNLTDEELRVCSNL